MIIVQKCFALTMVNPYKQWWYQGGGGIKPPEVDAFSVLYNCGRNSQSEHVFPC